MRVERGLRGELCEVVPNLSVLSHVRYRALRLITLQFLVQRLSEARAHDLFEFGYELTEP